MAHKKAGGSTALGRDSHGQRLGVKKSDGTPVQPGQIIVRQRGTPWHAGKGVSRGKDDTLFAIATGVVKFVKRQKLNFHGTPRAITRVEVAPK